MQWCAIADALQSNFVQQSVAVAVDIESECHQVPLAVFELFRSWEGASPDADATHLVMRSRVVRTRVR